eukprot:12922920-Prorocentrum_lima.AAC.1
MGWLVCQHPKSTGEPYPTWDPRVAHVLLPLCHLPKNATGTNEGVVRLAVGDTNAINWHENNYARNAERPWFQPTERYTPSVLLPVVQERRQLSGSETVRTVSCEYLSNEEVNCVV